MNFNFNLKKAEDKITIEATHDKIVFTGSITSQDPKSYLDPFFQEYHNLLIKNSVKKITMDLTSLFFLNSAGIRAFVDWVLVIEKLPADEQYTIEILYSKKILWQKTSVTNLVYINPKHIVKKEDD